MKQKSLMSFFSKPGGASNSNSANLADSKLSVASKKAGVASQIQPARVVDDTSSDPPMPEARTPLSKNASLSSVVNDPNYTRSSDDAESYAQTPPTSDPIDVDMLSEDEDDMQTKSATTKVRFVSVSVYLSSINLHTTG